MPMAIPAVATAVTSFGLSASAGLYAATGIYLSAAAISATAVAAANVAISVAVNALMQPKVGTSGSVDSYKSDPAAPIRGVMGRMAIGGNRIFKRTWGRTNVYLTSVALLSLGPCQAVEQFKANDQFVSFTQGQGGASGKYAGHMWMTYRYGLPGTSALTPPQGVFIENPKLTAWTSQHRADGHVTAMWTLAQAEDQQKRDLYTQGEPDALWIGRWMKAWDPRQDSTYPGGSGSQRRDQWNTWTYTDNPYLHALAWIRGHAKLNADGTVDRTKRIAGVGAPERAIDIAAYVEGANVADANEWKIAGEWSTSDDKWQVLAAMLQAGGGIPLNRGAQISCQINTPRAAIYTYTRNDLVGGASVKALKARRDRKNTVVPRYRSEAHGWEIVPAGAVTSSVYREEDRGEPRTIEIEYSYVTSAKQAGELGAYDVANMREGLETSLPSKPHLLGLRAGDAFTTDLPELGLVAQKFIVQRRAFDPQTGVVTLDVLSETDAKHAWALGQTANPPPTPSLVGVDPDYVAPPELPEWTVVVRPPAGDGSQQPGFEIIGGSPAADASSVVMEHGQSPTGPWKQFYDGALKTTGRVPIDGLQPGETYYVAVRYRRDSSGALSDRAIYGPYTAPPLTAGDVSPNAPSLQELEQRVNEAFGGQIGDVQETLDAARADIDANGTELAAARGTEPTLAGRVATLVQAQIHGDEVNALAISQVKARTDKAEADIINVSEAVSDEAGARAEAVAQVRAAQNVGANAMKNPSGELGLEGWVLNQGWSVDFYEPQGGKFYTRYFSSQTLTGVQVFAYRQPWAAKGPVTVSWSAAVVGLNSGSAEFYVEAHDAAGVKLGQSAPKSLHTGDGRQSITLDCPTNTASLLLVAYTVNAAGGAFAQLRLRALKVEAGSTATIFTTDGLARSTAASVTSQSLAIIDLETQQALARFELVAAASGGKPARFRMVSSSLGGSAIALDAAFIYLGDNTVFDDATDTEQTTVGSNIRVIAKGAPFGANGNLLEWWGPASTALGAMTTANGFNGRMTTAPYVFDNAVAAQTSKAAFQRFTGAIGRSAGTSTAGTTAALNVSAGGRFIVEVQNVVARSNGDGFQSQDANGSLQLQIGKNGNYTNLGSPVTISTSDTESWAPVDVSQLSTEVSHAFAGDVTFRVLAIGAGPGTSSNGEVRGALKATYYP